MPERRDAMGLTEPEIAELKRLGAEPRPARGSDAQNRLVTLGLASYAYSGPPGNLFFTRVCEITDLGCEMLMDTTT